MRSWIVPTALSALVVGLVAMTRKPGPTAGDVVGVPLTKLTLDNGQGLPSTVTDRHPANMIVAVKLLSSDGTRVRGHVSGHIDPATRVYTPVVEVGVGPVVVAARGEVTDIYRGGDPLKHV